MRIAMGITGALFTIATITIAVGLVLLPVTMGGT